jgi:hypothetical protein
MSQSATIMGQGAFPMDMLRHDACYPRHSTDAFAILRTVQEPGKTWTIQVMTHGKFEPRRWQSFGVGFSLDV